MIDRIVFSKSGLREKEIKEIVNLNQLDCISVNNTVSYNNQKTKNITDGVFIGIQATGKIKIVCSLHKYHSYLKTGRHTNYDRFTIDEATATGTKILIERVPMFEDMKVEGFEIGINIKVERPATQYIKLVNSIGKPFQEKRLFVNPRFKDYYERTTTTHKDRRTYYKIYDKISEMGDRKRDDIPVGNILRIETVYRRIDNLTARKLFEIQTFKRYAEQFYNEWQYLNFDRKLKTPSSINSSSRQIIKTALRTGNKAMIDDLNSQLEAGTIDRKQWAIKSNYIRQKLPKIIEQCGEVATEHEKEIRYKLKISRLDQINQ